MIMSLTASYGGSTRPVPVPSKSCYFDFAKAAVPCCCHASEWPSEAKQHRRSSEKGRWAASISSPSMNEEGASTSKIPEPGRRNVSGFVVSLLFCLLAFKLNFYTSSYRRIVHMTVAQVVLLVVGQGLLCRTVTLFIRGPCCRSDASACYTAYREGSLMRTRHIVPV